MWDLYLQHQVESKSQDPVSGEK
ncbi:hypothetical protein J1605_001141 [Eschrichtius robustus]|uniref:Uncharacterized protein n=1 Tax=Eschrichtius robustus TaxID=9764 RepID=A0AB34GE83_ESCRO|nr:hypothetical protein J1605_001141 [Eschrichtius robustus]